MAQGFGNILLETDATKMLSLVNIGSRLSKVHADGSKSNFFLKMNEKKL